jgi:hypothetical protein
MKHSVKPADPCGTAGNRRRKDYPQRPAERPWAYRYAMGLSAGRLSHNRRAASGGLMMYLMLHKFPIFQSPYIYLYLLKFFSFLFGSSG